MFTKTLLNKIFNFNFIIAAAIVASAFFVSYALVASALSEADIVYPVKELSGCKDETECRSYCNDPLNIKACVAFAEKYSLMSSEEIEQAKKFIAVGANGPGGCSSADSCESYCNDISHIDECLAFAEKSGLMPPDELEEARKVQAALASGATLPGGCRNKDECDTYCESPDHMEECIIFAEAAGFIPPDELEEARKVLIAVKAGAKPPPCRGRAECDAYCAEPDHFESCIAFAEAAGLIPPEEIEDAKKMLIALKKGVKPPPCGGREACDAYCGEENHFNECLDFAEAAGFIAPEEVEMARKTGGKGPGNCKGREECEAFCQDPANGESCFSFAKEHGLLKEEDVRQMEEGKQKILEVVDSAPPEVKSCLENALGSGTIEGIRAGTVMPRQDMGDTMRSCFEQLMQKPGGFGPPNGEFHEGSGPPPGFEGGFPPGFEGGQMPPEGMMAPGGMQPPEGFRPPEGFNQSGEFKPPEGMVPPEGMMMPSGQGEIPPEFKQQYQEQFQKEYQQQYEQQYQQEYQRQFEEQRRQQEQ
ncbi:MAG: hypothetical protein AAB771_01315, partial [Patescibacteria group bacterium]